MVRVVRYIAAGVPIFFAGITVYLGGTYWLGASEVGA